MIINEQQHKSTDTVIKLMRKTLLGLLVFSVFCATILFLNKGELSTFDKHKQDFGMNSAFRAVFVTVPSIEVGKKIAQGLVTKKLAACVNIIPGVTSIYEWEGKVEEDSELILMIKTQNSHFEELSKFVKENHPYDTPEVIALPIEQGLPQYLDWIKKVTTKTE